MKRRKFLSMLGAASAAPLMPMPALAATSASTPYSAAAMHGAILHAQSSSHVSTFGLSQMLKVPMPQAEAIMSDMAGRGILTPLNGIRTNSRWAASRIHHRHFAKLKQTTKPEPRETTHPKAQTHKEPDLDLMMAHLHKLCRDYGMPIAA